MKTLILIATILVLSSCDQLVPIFKNGYGYSVGDPYGKLHI